MSEINVTPFVDVMLVLLVRILFPTLEWLRLRIDPLRAERQRLQLFPQGDACCTSHIDLLIGIMKVGKPCVQVRVRFGGNHRDVPS